MDCRNSPSSDEMQILIKRSDVNPWRASGDLEKSILMKYYVGYRPVMLSLILLISLVFVAFPSLETLLTNVISTLRSRH